jgi:hypothetical protein
MAAGLLFARTAPQQRAHTAKVKVKARVKVKGKGESKVQSKA